MHDAGAVRHQGDLAEMVEMLLDKGVVVNADVVVSVGDTELLGVEIRAAIASFETAAEYGLEFPEGTDAERVESATERAGTPARRGENARSGGAGPREGRSAGSRPGGGARPSTEGETGAPDETAERESTERPEPEASEPDDGGPDRDDG